MNRRKLLIIVTTVFALCSSLFAKGDTYIYDYWGEVEKSPDVYRLLDVMYASDFDLDVNFIFTNFLTTSSKTFIA